MAKKASKPAKSNELDGKEFFTAIELIEKEKGIPKNYMLEKITQALISAYKRDHEGDRRITSLWRPIRRSTQTVRMYRPEGRWWKRWTNPDPPRSPWRRPGSALPRRPDRVTWSAVEIKPRNFGRIAAQTARQVIIQGMREAERNMIYDVFSWPRTHEMLAGTVTRIDPRNGAVSLRRSAPATGSPPTPTWLTVGEQVRSESSSGRATGMKVYVVEVRRVQPRCPRCSSPAPTPAWCKPPVRAGSAGNLRRHRGDPLHRPGGRQPHQAGGLVRRSENVDPIGACVGTQGRPGEHHRGGAELGSEKIDIIKYSDDPAAFVAAALSPAADVRRCPAPGRLQELPGGRAGRPALPGHRQGGAERPPGGQAHRLQDRHQGRVRRPRVWRRKTPPWPSRLPWPRKPPMRRPRWTRKRNPWTTSPQQIPSPKRRPLQRQRTPPTHSPWRAARAESPLSHPANPNR